MSFLKTKKFWIPFSVIGVGIVAIGTGVGLHQKHQNAINIYEGNSRGEIRTKLRNALETISPSDIRVNLNASGINRKSLTQTIGDSGLYAFNVSSNQLGLSSNVSVPSGIQIGFELDKEKNTLEKLNNGVLNIKLVATTPFSDEKQTRDLTLNTFKKADEKLSGLVNQNGTNSVLEIKPTKDTEKYKTIEQLNKLDNSISGLTTLYRSSLNNSNNYSIEGEVKLERIAKESDTVYFYLTSANDQWLKLVNKQGDISNETIFKEIKLTHLAASEIIVVPNGYVNPQTAQFGETLKASLKNQNKLAINVPETSSIQQQSNQKSVEVNIKPYFVINPQKSETLTSAVQVAFGNKIYDTNRVSDLNTLKEAGFKFNVYSKKLNESKKDLASTDINGMMKMLDKYFKQENFSKPVSKPTNSSFKCVSLDTTSNKHNVAIDVKNGAEKARAITSTQTNNIENWLLLADYSYTGLDSGTNVLFTPSLSVVHLEKTLVYMNDKK